MVRMLAWGRQLTDPIVALLARVGPLTATAVLSALLSLLAIAGSLTPNDDGMLYVEVARAYQTGGLEAARALFDWVFLSICMAWLSSVSGLSVEAAGYIISVALLAGTCVLLVACVTARFPHAGWPACVVVLALPGLNSYRDYIIREFGAWCFIVLAFLLLLQWRRKSGWMLALAIQLSICAAALFRVESLIFLPVLVLPLLRSLRQSEGWRHLAMMTTIPLAAVAVFVALWAQGGAEFGGRVDQLLAAMYPDRKFALFHDAVSELIAGSSFPLFSAHAQTILFLGLLGLLLVDFLGNFGVFLAPLLLAFHRDVRAVWRRRLGIFLIGGILYLATLVAYLFEHLFMTSRYVVLLNIMTVPLLALGSGYLWERLPRYRWAIGLILAVVVLDNVTSSRPEDLRYNDAAAWLAGTGFTEDQVHFDEPEMAYLAGMSVFRARMQKGVARDVLAADMKNGRLGVLLLDVGKRDPVVEPWVEANGLSIARRFSDRTGGEVVAVVPEATVR